MRLKNIFIGDSKLNTADNGVFGQFVDLEGEKYYQIQNVHHMADFFISIVSDSDHWMFISSNGSLSAGRKDRNNALFPYYTDDKIHDYKGITGSNSYFIIEKADRNYLWEPFTEKSSYFYKITRNLYKSVYGNSLIFEEVNHDLGLCFRYGWFNSEQFGFVKKSVLINQNHEKVNVKILDGIKNILPYGVDYAFQNEFSNLLDAYKKSELVENTSLGLFMLSAIPVDRAEPSEALKTTAVWSFGFGEKSKILISDKQITKFKEGEELDIELDIRASRGAYFINSEIELQQNASSDWYTIAEINLDSAKVRDLKHWINNTPNIKELVEQDIANGTNNLKKMVAYADGFQLTNTGLCYVRHFSNTLFNIMRGGVFINNYLLSSKDFKHYLSQINKYLFDEYQSWLDRLPQHISYIDLISNSKELGSADLLRIVYEYLPLTFSRRHGDPSRPWNQFSIETKNEDGSTKYNFQGNWRDIFQNWEALAYSFPEFVEGMISKFVNASTVDGYNPYRIMRDGIDWESPNPDDPWAYIGYWGDHQIIYLQKLLELSDKFHPGKLDDMLAQEIFTYANVPYQIKPYEQIVENPKDTVLFNQELNEQIQTEVLHLGADAKLLKSNSGFQIYKVNLGEKILSTLLSKMSNFIPEAGIWLNTQRPEWNDANNALVGNGTSMVTLYQLYRFLKFWKQHFDKSKLKSFSVSREMVLLFNQIYQVLQNYQPVLENGFNDENRRQVTDALGKAHSSFRSTIYKNSFSGKKKDLSTKEVAEFCNICLSYIDQSIRKNKREDGLYHAYNLVTFTENAISIRNLYEMLEGQVAILSAGILNVQESLDVLNALKNSAIYRKDQYSYMLYPNRTLPRFEEKNNIPAELYDQSQLLQRLSKDAANPIIRKDHENNYHFNGTFTNAGALAKALDNLDKEAFATLVGKEKELIFDIYEKIFDHKSFTGRSGTFYGYEGLGSIYWHMVSKLLLATQEVYMAAVEQSAEPWLLGQLKEHYYEIKAGIGLYKSPDLYGAFPTDAYSHTPLNAGVKQPGLTGQVKEDFISRMGEVGLIVKEGEIHFNSSLLNEEEILEEEQNFEYISLKGETESVKVGKDQIAYTFCQLPVVCSFSNEQSVKITFSDGQIASSSNSFINRSLSEKIFKRTGEIKLVEVTFIKE
jgi:hypothetical protein